MKFKIKVKNQKNLLDGTTVTFQVKKNRMKMKKQNINRKLGSPCQNNKINQKGKVVRQAFNHKFNLIQYNLNTHSLNYFSSKFIITET